MDAQLILVTQFIDQVQDSCLKELICLPKHQKHSQKMYDVMYIACPIPCRKQKRHLTTILLCSFTESDPISLREVS